MAKRKQSEIVLGKPKKQKEIVQEEEPEESEEESSENEEQESSEQSLNSENDSDGIEVELEDDEEGEENEEGDDDEEGNEEGEENEEGDDDDEGVDDGGDDQEQENIDLEASDTESDDDDDDEEEDDGNDDNTEKESSLEKLEPKQKKIIDKYRELQGKQLFIRFAEKLPEAEEKVLAKVKSLTKLAIKVHRPRQKSARFCLADFASKEDRDAALKAILEAIKTDEKLKGIHASLPKSESEEFLVEVAEKAKKALENKRAKAHLKRQKKKAMIKKVFTSSVVIVNLPKVTTPNQLRELFANAIDVNIKPIKAKSVDTTMATINFPTTLDATKATKQKMSLNGADLLIKFSKDVIKKSKKKSQHKQNKTKGDLNKKGPVPYKKKFSNVLK